jgi:hypothetical protein
MRPYALIFVCLLACLAAAMLFTPAPAAAPTFETKNSRFEFDLYENGETKSVTKVGHMSLSLMMARDFVIMKEDFVWTFKNKETGFECETTYRGDPPHATQARATTRRGTFKLSDSLVKFDASGTKATLDATGYADMEDKPFDKAQKATKEVAVPEGPALTLAAFMVYAPRLLKDTAQIPKATFVKYPAAIAFPDLFEIEPDCVLTRSPASSGGQTEYAMKHLLPGGNSIDVAAMTTDASGAILEVRTRKFTYRPPGSEAPSPPARPSAPATKAPPAKPAGR